MTAEHVSDYWLRLERIWNATLQADPANRADFLREACTDDPALLAELESLLESDRAAATFLERPALQEAASALAAERTSMVGRDLGSYRIRSLLGAGGMGEVYRATDMKLGRDVALKVLDPSLARNPVYVRRFEEEARSASRLTHPNIVTIFGVGEVEDLTYIAMELVQGSTLTDLLAAHVTTDMAVALATQLADGLAAAHACGIVHRDLKPDNVMVTSDGLVKVLDFGIAKRDAGVEPAELREHVSRTGVTEGGLIVGTVGYMSPEQALGRPLDSRSDQFSFGAILYEMLSGTRAFDRPTRAETIAAIVHGDPLRTANVVARTPPDLGRVLARCLAKDPADRYSTTRELADALRSIRNRGTRVTPTTSLTRRRLLQAGAAVAATAVVGAIRWRRSVAPPAFRTIAVLPFANPLDDRDLEYLCDGVASSLIRRLSFVPAIKVSALSAVMHKSTANALEIGRQLDVDVVLTGSIERRADRLMISAELVQTATGHRVWGSAFDRPVADVMAVQDEIATAIVAQAVPTSSPDSAARQLGPALTNDPDAYDLYLQAVHYFRLEREDDYLTARRLLERAVSRDRRFALAYVTLASTYSVMAIDGYESPRTAWVESTANVTHALKLDPDSPDAHAEATSGAFYFRWDWAGAEREWQQALESRRAEVQPELLTNYALQQWALGRTQIALKYARAARLADPLSAACTLREADLLAYAGAFDEAASLYEKVIASDQDDPRAFFGLAEVRRRQRRFDDALAERRRAHNAGGGRLFDALFSSLKGEPGYRQIEQADALVQLAGFRDREASGRYVSPLEYARVHATLGHTDESFRFLSAALQERAAGLVFLKVDPVWGKLRDDSRFDRAVRAVGLP